MTNRVSVAAEPADGPCTLSQLRIRAGLTAADVARSLMVSRSTVSHWEASTHRPAPVYRPALASALGVPLAMIERAVEHLPASRSEAVRLPGLGQLRRSRGLSAHDLATAMGIARSTLSTWETGAVPVSRDRLADLAAALGVRPVMLIRCCRLPAPAPDRTPLTVWSAGRRSRHMTQREAAAVLGVSVSHLSRIENGHRDPRPALAAAMVRTYRLTQPRPTDELRWVADTTVLGIPRLLAVGAAGVAVEVRLAALGS